jgi:positive regulator of sigma E activity
MGMFIDGINGERGEIIAREGGRVTVMLEVTGGCEKCRLCTRVSETEMTVEAYTEEPFQVGDRVALFLSPHIIVASAAILYIFPLISMVAGYFVGKTLFGTLVFEGREEMIPALFSLLFFFLSFIPIRLFDKKRQRDRRHRVQVRAADP